MSKRSTVRVMFVLTAVALLGSLVLVPIALGDGPLYTMTERFGVGLSGHVPYSISDYDLSGLRIGWYSDWGVAADPDRPDGIEYAQLVWVREGNVSGSPAAIAAVASANPSALWMIGNEPENIWQGHCTPAQYASAYNQAYTMIKGADPTARVAVGGVTQPTPLRLEWLEQVLASYNTQFGVDMRSHIDVWTIHVQITPERRGSWGAEIPVGLPDNVGETFGMTIGHYTANADVNILKQLIYDFCEWLMDQGERDKELIISEYGVLFPSDYLDPGDPDNGDQMVIDFMTGSFDFFLSAKDSDLGLATDEGRLVQRWLWYSLNGQPFPAPGGFNGSLFEWDDPTQLTIFGEAYRDYVFGSFKAFLPLIFKP